MNDTGSGPDRAPSEGPFGRRPSGGRPSGGRPSGAATWGARVTGVVIRHAVVVLALAAVCLAVAAVTGYGVHDRLSPGGTTAFGAPFETADHRLEAGFRAGSPDLVVVARGTAGVDDAAATASGTRLTELLAGASGVTRVTSYWTEPMELRPSLRSRDGRSALILARLAGTEMQRVAAANRLASVLNGRHGPLTAAVTGEAQVKAETQRRSADDLAAAELIAAPLSLAILLLVFGSLLAAVLPVLVGVLAITVTMAVLRLLTELTSVSVFAMSITTALGFALAVDFSLFILTRFREELAAGRASADAVRITMSTTGRAMAYSAATVSLALTCLLVFPFPMYHSIAYGGITVTVVAAAGSLLVLPAALVLLGARVNSLPVRLRRRRPALSGTPAPLTAASPGPGSPAPASAGTGVWSRIALLVMRRPWRVAVPTVLVLAAMGAPFLGVRFGVFDDRLLPPQSAASHASQQLRRDFDARGTIAATTVLLPDLHLGADAAELDGYARRLSALRGVTSVRTATGSYTRGARVPDTTAVPPDDRITADTTARTTTRETRPSPDGALAATPPASTAARFTGPAGTWLAVATAYEPYSAVNGHLAQQVRRLPAPGPVLVGGPGAHLADTRGPIAAALPMGLGAVALITFALVAGLTGSVVLAVKAVLMNALSLTASFGVLVYIFQDGHLRWLVGDFSVTGHIDVLVPALLFCIAFALSMDYEIFLLSRITEEYRRCGDTTTAVATGLQNTGRLFTSAAVIFAVVMAAMATSSLALLKMIGVGLAVAVLLDATLIRALLVPAVMRLAGRANWWTPWPRRIRTPSTAPATEPGH
ncbi:MMPL family transporter [Actinomadura gamaensis]|uniref:MMPL family transporter n=1 Tax=Actinomadura gamaensis TaxID=1763541 RepID=A0ABV9TVY5_9ACTN